MRGRNKELRRPPFKFFHFWANKWNFMPIVESVWNEDVIGSPMYYLCTKLKKVKFKLKELNKRKFWCLPKKVKSVRNMFECV